MQVQSVTHSQSTTTTRYASLDSMNMNNMSYKNKTHMKVKPTTCTGIARHIAR